MTNALPPSVIGHPLTDTTDADLPASTRSYDRRLPSLRQRFAKQRTAASFAIHPPMRTAQSISAYGRSTSTTEHAKKPDEMLPYKLNCDEPGYPPHHGMKNEQLPLPKYGLENTPMSTPYPKRYTRASITATSRTETVEIRIVSITAAFRKSSQNPQNRRPHQSTTVRRCTAT